LIEDGLNSTVRITTLTTQLEAERERATKAEERCEAYKGQVEAGAKEIERLREALQEIRDMRTELPGRDGYERGFNDARFRCKNIADEALKAGSSADE
jgi:chromosome segregation ATPase